MSLWGDSHDADRIVAAVGVAAEALDENIAEEDEPPEKMQTPAFETEEAVGEELGLVDAIRARSDGRATLIRKPSFWVTDYAQ